MKFDDIDYWKAIILFGLNSATYKMALANVLLDSIRMGETTIDWSSLSERYLISYIDRLKSSHPQQGNPSRLTIMERIINDMKMNQITYEQAIERVSNEAFEDVIPRFHTIGRDRVLAKEKFYEFQKGKHLNLKDSLLQLDNPDELKNEVDARWSLLEGAFLINQTQYSLTNNIREIYVADGYGRKSLTPIIPFLRGYQTNTCFYCREPILNDIHVDHVLPRQVIRHDEVWNLVLSHPECNMNKSDKVVGLHFIEKLIARNENIMGSNHPWKHKISASLGKTKSQRRSSVIKHYDNIKKVLGNNYWNGSKDYDPSKDSFHKRLITILNNQ